MNILQIHNNKKYAKEKENHKQKDKKKIRE